MDNPLERILDESRVEVYIVDVETRKYVYANQSAQRNLGYTLEELREHTPELVSPHLSLAGFRKILDPAWNNPGHKPIVMSNTHRRKDGSEYPVDVHLQLSTYEGRPAFVGFVVDASAKQKELDLLRNVIKGAKLGCWDYNEVTGEFFVDDHWLAMLGLKRGDVNEADPSDWQRLIHPDDRDKTMQAVHTAVTSQRSYTLEFRMLHKDGHVVWIQSNGAVVEWDPKQERSFRLSGTHLDITERKQNELEKEQFLFFFDIAPDIMVIVNPVGSLIKVNAAAQQILGYSEEELLSRPFIEFVYEPDRQPTRDAVIRHIQDGYTNNFENRYVCKDGSLCWLSWSSSYDPKAGITYATARNITEQKQIQEQLKDQEEINRALIENSEDLIILYDRNHNYLYVNPALGRTLGIPQEELIGSSRENFEFPPELRKFWHDTIERVFQTGNPESQVYEIDTPVGRLKMLWNAFPGLRSSDGEIRSVFGVSHNVTEHIRAEEEIQKMERLESLGVLAGGIAHDFNNILTILFGNIATAKARLEDPEAAKNSLENAEKAFHRASYLTNQLLTFAKGGEPMKEELNLAKLVKETVSFDLSGSNSKLELHVANDLWLAQVDRGQVAQVFSNLTINADQAMPNGGCLTITLDNLQVGKNEIKGIEAGNYILARVKDEGVGIHAGELAKIFDPYYSTKQAGSGLGLATVYSIINRHSGHISVSSTPGEGTIFEILLPASLASPREVPNGKEASGVAQNRDNRILVMDDEDMICDLAERILEREGYEVDTAKNGEEALDLVQKALAAKTPYDCIIMDLTIPGGMGGKEAVKKVLQLDPGAKVIVSSGYAVDPVMANFTDYGFKGVITKPFTIKALSDEVERLVG